jgi:nitrogen fixation protein NifU and related proteins
MYSPQVLDHFENPRNAGEMTDASARVQVENPVCGDVLEVALKTENGIITHARFRARGCVASVACASRLTEMLVEIPVANLQKITREALVESLGGLPQGSQHAADLSLDALAALTGELKARS